MANFDEIQRLILKWEIVRLGYWQQLKDTKDPEIVKTILSMDFQLAKCIDELTEAASDIGVIRRLLEGIQEAQKEEDVDTR